MSVLLSPYEVPWDLWAATVCSWVSGDLPCPPEAEWRMFANEMCDSPDIVSRRGLPRPDSFDTWQAWAVCLMDIGEFVS